MSIVLRLKKLYSKQLLIADKEGKIDLAYLEDIEEELLLSIWYQGVLAYVNLFTREDALFFSRIPEEKARYELRESVFSYEHFREYIHRMTIQAVT